MCSSVIVLEHAGGGEELHYAAGRELSMLDLSLLLSEGPLDSEQARMYIETNRPKGVKSKHLGDTTLCKWRDPFSIAYPKSLKWDWNKTKDRQF